jgi:hypothetical protein
MCTLSYIPKADGFLLTSNRDESVNRLPALPPMVYTHNGIAVMYPKDTQAGGTWLAVAENRFTICLLNGAFHKHHHNPPYRHSRGLVVTDFFTYNDISAFKEKYTVEGLEPFTLVVIESGFPINVHEIRWDGAQVFAKTVDASIPQIWSSATLYDAEVIVEREKWFHQFLADKPNPSPEDMLHFHHFGGGQNEQNRLLMNRNNILRTISITGIQHLLTKAVLHHENLLTSEFTQTEIAVLPGK